MTDLTTDIAFDPAVDQIGWQVVDPAGNIVASGPVVVAEMAGETAELLLGLSEAEQ